MHQAHPDRQGPPPGLWSILLCNFMETSPALVLHCGLQKQEHRGGGPWQLESHFEPELLDGLTQASPGGISLLPALTVRDKLLCSWEDRGSGPACLASPSRTLKPSSIPKLATPENSRHWFRAPTLPLGLFVSGFSISILESPQDPHLHLPSQETGVLGTLARQVPLC